MSLTVKDWRGNGEYALDEVAVIHRIAVEPYVVQIAHEVLEAWSAFPAQLADLAAQLHDAQA
ncbi:hypothetical protein D9M69_712230 [compost metagenome]